MPLTQPTDIRILQVRTSEAAYAYRTPFKFGGRISTHLAVLSVACEVETRAGRRGWGRSAMSLGNSWAYPSVVMDSEQTLAAMRSLAGRCAALMETHGEFGHPVDLGVQLEEKFLAEASRLTTELQLPQPIPKLATLVTGSPFDAAIHDAFGRIHGLNCYSTYGQDFMSRDLGAYLGPDYRGHWLESYIRSEAAPTLPLYHLVGALDPLAEADVRAPVGDGLPETLSGWIRRDGLSHLKIKLNGDDLTWDLERVIAVDRVAMETAARGVEWSYSLDFNERCQNVDYLIALLQKLRERTPRGFDRVQYVEQPTARDLRANPQNKMQAAAKLKPVVIDESLTDLESLLLAQEMGYTGVALKACKGQSRSLLMAAAAQRLGLFLCVQDLTCPGAAFIHSAGLAAHIPGATAIEGNARQYCPEANLEWLDRFSGLFQITDGQVRTAEIGGVGLGGG